MRELRDARPVFKLTESKLDTPEYEDGAQSSDGRIWGTHVHGLFDADAFRRWWLNRLRQRKGLSELPATPTSSADGVYDRLAHAVRAHLDLQAISRILGV